MLFNNVMKGTVGVNKVYMGTQLVYEREGPAPDLEIVETGLVVYYDFKGITNTTSGNTVATDLSGNGNHSNLLNFAFTANSGYTAAGLRFDGVDDMIKGTGHTGLPTGNDSFSMEVVSLKPTGYDPAAYMTLMAIGLGPMFTSVNGYRALEMKPTNDVLYLARYVGDESPVPEGFPTFPLNQRTHLTVTYDGATRFLQFYYNGEAWPGRTLSEDLTTQANPPLYIGLDEHDYSEGRQHIFQAARVYNRALTATEVEQNYNYDVERWGS